MGVELLGNWRLGSELTMTDHENHKEVVLFLPPAIPSLIVMKSLAIELLKSDQYYPILVLNDSLIQYLKNNNGCDCACYLPRIDKLYDLIEESTAQPDNGEIPAEKSVKLKTLKSSLKSLVIGKPGWGLPIEVAKSVLKILYLRPRWKRIIKRFRPVAAYVWGDNSGGPGGDLLNQFSKHGVKIIHTPVAMSDQNVIAQLRVKHPQFYAGQNSSLINRVIARKLPYQTLLYNGKRILYYPVHEILAMLFLGMLPNKPWILGMCRADYVCLSEESMRSYWISKGTDNRKIVVTGFVELDDPKIYPSNSVEHDDNKTVRVLVGLPQLIEHNYMSNWSDYWNDIDRYLSIIKKMPCQLIIVLHPKCNKIKYTMLEDKYNCRVIIGDTAAQIVNTDIYIAAGSTTELWAVQLGKQVVDISGLYGFNSETLKLNRGIFFASTIDEYRKKLIHAFSVVNDDGKGVNINAHKVHRVETRKEILNVLNVV